VKFKNAYKELEKVTKNYHTATNERESLDDIELDDAPVSLKTTYSHPSRNVYYNTQDVWDMVDAPQETPDKKRARLNDVSPQEWDRVAKAVYKL